jgi:hypothetical protein
MEPTIPVVRPPGLTGVARHDDPTPASLRRTVESPARVPLRPNLPENARLRYLAPQTPLVWRTSAQIPHEREPH